MSDVKLVTMYFWVPTFMDSGPGTLAGKDVAEEAMAYRPAGGRLITLAPAGSSFSPGTFFAAWEVEA